MNNIYSTTIAALFAASLTFTACSLDYEPISELSELTQGSQTDTTTAVLKDKSAAQDQLKTLYEKLRNRQEHWHMDLNVIGDVHSDNAYGGTTGAEVTPYEQNAVDPSHKNLSRDWDRYLDDIAAANVLINGLDQLHAKGQISETEYHSMQAQGKIFRAMVMFSMARIWGAFPVITKVAKTITAANIEKVYPTYFPPKSDAKTCYELIVSDLKYGLKYAPDFNKSDRTRMSKTVAAAWLAKVYAEQTLQDYNKVVQYADMVINTPGLKLEPKFETLWGWNDKTKDCVKRNTSESILEVQYFTGSPNWESWMYGRSLENYDFFFNWAKWVTPSRDLIADFEREGDTERLNQTVVYYSCTWSNYYPANHYPFMYKLRSGLNNVYKLRLADIILMKAEAEAYLGNLQQAVALVNQIRHRAKLAPLATDKTATSQAVKDAVLHERRLELAFEGERWFDLVRTKRVEEFMNGINKRDKGRLPQLYPFNEYSYKLPIPQTALDKNDNLKQNPGY